MASDVKDKIADPLWSFTTGEGKGGSLIWMYETGSYVSSSSFVMNDKVYKVYIGSSDHYIYCLSTGRNKILS
ncbi:MAG: hypothetical protein ACUVWP_03170 [bacterium]